MSLHYNYEDYEVNGNITSFPNNAKLTKRQRRQLRKEQQQGKNSSLKIRNVQPKTKNQDKVFMDFDDGYNLLLHGLAGTGKTFISLYLALADIIEGYGDQRNVTLVRSVVPTRDMGYLPGNQKEKSKVYEAPYANICSELFGRGDAYEVLKGRGMIDFITTSFVRGVTLSDTTVIVDECQNLSFHELDSIITRLGENSRIIFCGDFRQSDLTRDEERKGVLTFMKILSKMKGFESVEFEEEDIVRSKLVKEYIISKVRSGIV
jgi:phosphate starvation-inducible protein PhoH